MFCYNCGNQNPNNNAACSACGAPFENLADAAQPQPVDTAQSYAQGQPPYGAPPYAQGQPPYGTQPYAQGQPPYGTQPYAQPQPSYAPNPYYQPQPIPPKKSKGLVVGLAVGIPAFLLCMVLVVVLVIKPFGNSNQSGGTSDLGDLGDLDLGDLDLGGLDLDDLNDLGGSDQSGGGSQADDNDIMTKLTGSWVDNDWDNLLTFYNDGTFSYLTSSIMQSGTFTVKEDGSYYWITLTVENVYFGDSSIDSYTLRYDSNSNTLAMMSQSDKNTVDFSLRKMDY